MIHARSAQLRGHKWGEGFLNPNGDNSELQGLIVKQEFAIVRNLIISSNVAKLVEAETHQQECDVELIWAQFSWFHDHH